MLRSAVLAAVLGAALAACSGGGGSTLTPSSPSVDTSRSDGTVSAVSAIAGYTLPTSVAQGIRTTQSGSSGMSIDVNGAPLAQTSSASPYQIAEGGSAVFSTVDSGNTENTSFLALDGGTVWPVLIAFDYPYPSPTQGVASYWCLRVGWAGASYGTTFEVSTLEPDDTSAACFYPQTMEIMFIDPVGDYATLFVEES